MGLLDRIGNPSAAGTAIETYKNSEMLKIIASKKSIDGTTESIKKSVEKITA